MIAKVRDIIIYLILAIGISPLSSAVRGQNIKLPFLVLGVFLLLLFNKHLTRIFKNNLSSRYTQVPLLIAVAMGVMGFITGSDKNVVITDSIAVLSFIFFFFMKIKSRTEYDIVLDFAVHLCWTISVLETFYLVNGLYTPDFEVGSAAEGRVITLTICPFFLSMYYLKNRQILLSVSALAMMVYMCLIGAMRINYFFPICYILYMFFTFFRDRTMGVGRKVMLVTVIVFSTISIFPIAKAFLEADHVRYINAVTRFEALFNDDDTFDESTRSGCNQVIVERPYEFIIPEGLGWSNHTRKIQSRFRAEYNILGTVDSNFLYCVYHFGLFIGLWLIYRIAWGCAKSIMDSKKYSLHPMLDIYNYVLVCILALFILKAWVFVYFSFGITYGLFSALSLNRHVCSIED